MNSSSDRSRPAKNRRRDTLPLLIFALACCLVIALACEAMVTLVSLSRGTGTEQN